MKYPRIEFISERNDNALLVEDFVVNFLQDRFYITDFTIKKGFLFDGSSIPSFLEFVTGYKRFSINLTASIVHDFIYLNRGKILLDNGATITLTRREADDIFYYILKQVKYSGFKSKIAYYGVRLFGWVAWN
jgi:hypothetical protein